jgi:hypothetical protein
MLIIERKKMAISLFVGYFAYRPKDIPEYNKMMWNLQKDRLIFRLQKIMHKLQLFTKKDFTRISEKYYQRYPILKV